ncbi:AsmA family protein [Marinomonas algarum]|uniref:AsmA family protein n=1 Tax=Marinomonas algarum TaxID=2883105 RepID=A0A9X1INF0_9GAMM|nr:AsmA family protein [Marinomonas algarum]MCB5161236.1 AsmA family protein [Marinomonas algarum]
MVWIKRLLLIIAGVIALLAMALAYVMVFVDPNDFKDELKTIAAEKADVTLRLDGDISWSFFPWLGLELEDIGVALGADDEIVQFDRAEFGLAILPLLEQKIQVDNVTLVNLKANLQKDAQGRGNWEMTSSSSSVTTEDATSTTASSASSRENLTSEEAPSALSLPDLQLDTLIIENAQVSYRDEQADQLINATLNVTLSDVQWDTAWPMVMDIVVTQSDLQKSSVLTAKASLNANLAVFPSREALSLDSLVLNGEVMGDALPASPINAKFSAMTVDVDLPQENLLVDGLTLSSLGVNLDAKLQAYQILSAPQFSAVMSIGEFNPRYLLTRLNMALPDMADESALTKARANLTFEGDLNTITAQPISLFMDDTSIEANAVLDLSPLRWDVSVAGKNLDLDRYLPAPVEENENASKEAVTSAQIEAKVEEQAPSDLLPIDTLRDLNGHVGVVFEDLTVKKLKIDKIELDSTQFQGLVEVSPLRASLYKGTVSSQASLDVRGKTPVLSLVPNIDNVQIQPLLVDFMELDKIAGATYLNGELNATGNRIDDLMSSLQGDLLVEVRNGALVGVNVTKTVCQGIASVRNESIDESAFGPDTPFESLRFPAYIVDGKISTPGLDIRSAGVQITGDGVISLPDSSLNYQANVGISGSEMDNACRVNEKYASLAFPIVCKGQFSDDPAGLCGPDLKGFGKLFADLAKEELKVKAEAEKARAKAKLEEKRVAEEARLKEKFEAEKERAKEKLKEKLKGLF